MIFYFIILTDQASQSMSLLVHLLPQFAFNVTVFNILLLFSLTTSSLLSTRNVGHFV